MSDITGFSGLRSREMLGGDIPRCKRLLAEKTPYEGLHCSGIEIWPELLDDGRMKAAVVEDASNKIIAFGASVFLSESFAARINQKSTPLIGHQIMASMFTSSPSVCAIDEVASGNASSGTKVFIIHSGLSDVSGPFEETNIVKAQLLAAFLELHRGYCVSSLMVEAYGEGERSVYEATNFHVLNDYSSFTHWDLLPIPPYSHRPQLMSLSRREAMSLKTHILLPLFVYNRPQCGFSLNEQRLLREALKGHTDEELAISSNLSLDGIKKQWIRIFDKAEKSFPELVLPRRMQTNEKVRGPQRRHILLRAIRGRPEELTPYPQLNNRRHCAAADRIDVKRTTNNDTVALAKKVSIDSAS